MKFPLILEQRERTFNDLSRHIIDATGQYVFQHEAWTKKHTENFEEVLRRANAYDDLLAFLVQLTEGPFKPAEWVQQAVKLRKEIENDETRSN